MTYQGRKVPENAITAFSGDYFFLSNFYNTWLLYDGFLYPSSEAAFQAQKSLDPEVKRKFMSLSPSSAKSLGKRVKLREDWEQVKGDIMYSILKVKFSNPDLQKKLLDTGDRELFEGNTWNDKCWGVVSNGREYIGDNKLGNILMRIREEMR